MTCQLKLPKLSNKLLETLKTIENCSSCKNKKMGKNDIDKFHQSINEIKSCLVELKKGKQEKYEIISKLNDELFKINIRLNKEILCEDCKGKKSIN